MPPSHSNAIPRWKIALAVGGVVAVGGVAYWYYRRNKRSPTITAASKKAAAKQPSPAPKPNPSLSKAKQLKEEGNHCFKISDYKQAIEKYSAAAEACTSAETEDLAMIYQNRAATYEKMQELEAALADCNRALEVNPAYVKAMLRRSKIYERQGKMEECFEDLGAVLVCDRFENQEALSMYDRVLKTVAENKASKAIMNAEHAQFLPHRFAQLSGELYRDPLLLDLKNTPSVVENGENDGAANGETHEAAALYKQLLAAMKAGRYGDSYALLGDDALSHLPPCNDTAKLHLAKGSLAMTTNRYHEAIKEFNWIIENGNCDTDVRVNALVKRSIVEQCTGRTSECAATLAEAQKLDEKNVDVAFHFALLHLINEDLDAGVKYLVECVALEPDHVAKIKKAMFDYMGSSAAGDTDRSDSILNEIVAYLNTHPYHNDFVELVGQMYCERGDFEKAEALYEKYLKTENGGVNPTVLILQSVLSLQWKQDTEKAETLIEAALKIDPQCHLAYEARGLIKLQQGDVSSALESLGRAAACCRSIIELQRIISLRESVQVQDKYAKQFNMPLGRGGPPGMAR